MKKILSFFLFLTLMLACVPFSLAEDVPEAYTSGDYQYVVLDDGTVEITAYFGNDTVLDFPAELDGKTVSGIGDGLFSHGSLKRITIPDSVTSVGVNPFKCCSELAEVYVSPDHPYLAVMDGVLFSKPDGRLICYPQGISATEYAIPQGVQIIGDTAFYECSGLVKVTIPDSVTSIGDYAFSGCSGLTEVTIPGSVVSIGEWAFSGCSGLTEVTIPEGTASVGNYAFIDCSGLTEATIPDSMTSVGANPFLSCGNLEKIVVSPDHQYLVVMDGVLFSKPDSRLICYPAGLSAAKYEIPEGIQIIGEDAFAGCDGLAEITIPDSVASIGEGAFARCSGLSGIIIPDGVTSIGGYAFAACSGLAEAAIPGSVASIGKYAFSGCSGLTEITIPDGVASIGDYAFFTCYRLSGITIPDSVTDIGEGIFAGCSEPLRITVGRDSCAEQYCIDNGLAYTYANPLD